MIHDLLVVIYSFLPMTIVVGVSGVVSYLILKYIFKYYHFR